MCSKYIRTINYFLLGFVFTAGNIFAQSRSENYTLKKNVIDMSGGAAVSAQYQLTSASGQPAATGISARDTHQINSGFLAEPVVATVVEEQGLAGMPAHFKLHQNYPNPFNSETVIRFEVKESSQVTLTVYDVLGRQSALLVGQNFNPGVYQARFNASFFPAGVYFYRIQMGSYCAVRKMILLE
jgi:hypothetical protein